MARRFLIFPALLVFCCLALVFSAPAAAAKSDSRYAALVIDADSGAVLYAANANEPRYPASLTKMMTIYLTFEALESKRLSLGSRLKVSQKAAGMPQTNIGLKKGDSIEVRDVLGALVVRSANDAAVVIAEALGGGEREFAARMTAKARALGMKNTVFRNASGLPDGGQRTTARDLTVLALALRKHYPQYFHFFRTKEFRYRGKLYKTHNRVLNRYPGAEGIKTGYIRASGFNVATSARRNGHTVIALVMGGETARRRDDHMIELLDRSFAKLENGGAAGAARMLPAPKPKPGPQEVDVAYAQEISPAARGRRHDGPAMDAMMASGAAREDEDRPVPAAAMIPERRKDAGMQLASAGGGGDIASSYKVWGIQVGAFDGKDAAYDAVAGAMRAARKELANSRPAVSDAPGGKVGQVIYRARLANLSEDEARDACKALIAGKASCFVFRAESAGDL